ncbi:MAG TPA: hypothetical protein VFE27_05170 [Acidobacteriaceae bacterium]|nr:hypothetical protein [Acidobacteriaceae bacterium]
MTQLAIWAAIDFALVGVMTGAVLGNGLPHSAFVLDESEVLFVAYDWSHPTREDFLLSGVRWSQR